MTAITKTAGEIIETGTSLITLGGDHSIALPLLRAHAKKYGPVSLVHIDAHIDTWEAEFEAVPYSHGTPFRYALQEGLIRKNEYMQIGIRGPVSGENDYAESAIDMRAPYSYLASTLPKDYNPSHERPRKRL